MDLMARMAKSTTVSVFDMELKEKSTHEINPPILLKRSVVEP
jgi:hypothetical protein